MGGKFHLKLNIDERPIANKYREGKMKRTLKRELKVPEIAEREADEISVSVLADVSVCLGLLHLPVSMSIEFLRLYSGSGCIELI